VITVVVHGCVQSAAGGIVVGAQDEVPVQLSVTVVILSGGIVAFSGQEDIVRVGSIQVEAKFGISSPCAAVRANS
jgi:hypothetical protein